jgi:uncharacterized FAD-dependent dehydrogenase
MTDYRVWGIRLPLGKGGDEHLRKTLARMLDVRIEAIDSLSVVRKSLDARGRKRPPSWVFTVDCTLLNRPGRRPPGVRVEPVPATRRAAIPEDKSLEGLDAAVVGTGPAGLFAAAALAARGATVTVLEQGPPLEDRVSAVRNLWRAGALSGDANVQFGEGGAGTFSDGKLTTRIKDPLVAVVLSRFVGAGASETILSEAHPHLGTDGVRRVVRAMREQLEARGAAFQFRRTVLSVRRSGAGYEVETGDGRARADAVFLAVGHSSRPLFRSLMAMGVTFRPKGMAVGVRVEHPQSWADACQYGRYAGHPDLPPSEYFLTFKDGPTGRGVYSFCMCPGGVVVNSASEPDSLVTNGMSMSHRASGRANAGIVVTVEPLDFGGDPLRGVVFQEELERRAFLLGGGGYRAPAQRIRSFLGGRSDEAPLKTTFKPGVSAVDLRGFFPPWIEGPLARAFVRFDRTMPGFIEYGVMLAPETRTSSPLQVERGEDGCARGFPGLCLVGEGAGWSGGIVSSGVDALRCVEVFAKARS